MNEIRLFFKALIQRLLDKVSTEVSALKAKYEAEKQAMIAEFAVIENDFKTQIEEICAYPTDAPVTEAAQDAAQQPTT